VSPILITACCILNYWFRCLSFFCLIQIIYNSTWKKDICNCSSQTRRCVIGNHRVLNGMGGLLNFSAMVELRVKYDCFTDFSVLYLFSSLFALNHNPLFLPMLASIAVVCILLHATSPWATIQSTAAVTFHIYSGRRSEDVIAY
jgi:hypothetical protein